MSRYINRPYLNTYLSLGKFVEVFLGRINADKNILSYLEIKQIKSSKIQISIIEHYDEGCLDWVDIYGFSYVRPYEECERIEFSNTEKAIEFIQMRFQLKEIKFMNQGIIQEEYKDLLTLEGRT